MNRSQAKKALKDYAEWMLPAMIAALENQQEFEHGGWDEIEDDAEALVTLGLTESAEACRVHLIRFLLTNKGLKVLEKHFQPNFDHAKRLIGDDED